MSTLQLKILTPDKKLVDVAGVSEVFFPGDYGVLGILPGHAPLVTGIGTGIVVYTFEDSSGFYHVSGGVAEVTGTTVTLLADVSEEATSIDLERARKSLERAQTLLSSKDGQIDLKRAQAAKARAEARLEVAERLTNKKTKNSP